jgi:hypothetical protein
MRQRSITVSQTHTTRDLYFAAYLQTTGAKLVNTLRNGDRCYLVYEVEDVATLKREWYGGHGQVVAVDYAQSVKAIKAMIMTLA